MATRQVGSRAVDKQSGSLGLRTSLGDQETMTIKGKRLLPGEHLSQSKQLRLKLKVAPVVKGLPSTTKLLSFLTKAKDGFVGKLAPNQT